MQLTVTPKFFIPLTFFTIAASLVLSITLPYVMDRFFHAQLVPFFITRAEQDAMILSLQDLIEPSGAQAQDPLDAAAHREMQSTDLSRLAVWSRDGKMIWGASVTSSDEKFPETIEFRRGLNGQASVRFKRSLEMAEVSIPLSLKKTGAVQALAVFVYSTAKFEQDLSRISIGIGLIVFAAPLLVLLVTILLFRFLIAEPLQTLSARVRDFAEHI